MQLEIQAPTLRLSVAQVAHIIGYFPSTDSTAGYLRVQVLLALFNCIVDMENVRLIKTSILTALNLELQLTDIIDDIFNFDEYYEVR